MVTMWDLRQCFGWQMWMRWHKSEEAGRNCLRAWVGRSPVSKKQSVFHWPFCYWLNHTKKMALKRKSFVTPLTMILLLTKTYVFTFLSGRRSTVFCTAHSKRWCALVECRKSDRSRVVLRLCSWAEAKSYCTALPEPWNQMGLWSPRSTELSGNLYLS